MYDQDPKINNTSLDPSLKQVSENTESVEHAMPEKKEIHEGALPELVQPSNENEQEKQLEVKQSTSRAPRGERRSYHKNSASQERYQDNHAPREQRTSETHKSSEQRGSYAHRPPQDHNKINENQPSPYSHSGNQPQREYKPRENYQRQYQSQQQAPVTLEELSLTDLNIYARRLGIVGASLLNKVALLERIKYIEAHPDLELEVSGVLEKLPDGFGFLRSASL